jgi:natural product precursor
MTIMKKLSKLKLTKVSRHDELKSNELQRIKGGACQAWQCQCNLDPNEAQNIDDELERQDREGYI